MQFLFRPAEETQAASYKSRLLLLLQVQSNLLGLFLLLCIISQIILLSKSQLYGLSHIVAAVNKAFSFGLIHACPCFMLSRFGESVCDLFVVSTSKIIPRSQVNLLFAESHVYAGSCVNVYIIDRIIDRNTPNYSKSNASQSEWFSPVYSMASSLNRR